MTINLNEKVWVRLNDYGKSILFARWNKYSKTTEKQILKMHAVKNDWYEFQIWDLMNTFGPHLSIGFNTPFEVNELRFTAPD